MAFWSRTPEPVPSPADAVATHVEEEPEVVDPDAIYEPGEDAEHAYGTVPGIARVTASVIGHTGTWAAGAYFRAGKRVVGVVVAPSTGLDLMREITAETTRTIAAIADATDLDRRLQEAGPAGEMVRRAAQVASAVLPSAELAVSYNGVSATRSDVPRTTASLRAQGEDLLRRSRDVNDAYEAHPAYARILSELAPDEARILRLMLLDGPQPTVDVRTGGPLGLINSRLIAPGLSMIGARAGCRYVERVPSYLNNLFRLGLVWFSRETLRNHQRYQVLEAQPDVLEAIHSVAAAKVVRRSVHLTPFGEDFCQVCLGDEVEDVSKLPEHSAPREADTVPQPPNEKLD